MRKSVYITLFFIGLFLVSCTKEEIVPNSEGNIDVSAWESSFNRSGENGNEDDNAPGKNDEKPLDDEEDITDPNIDPDGEK